MEWEEGKYGHTLELPHGSAFVSSDDASGWGVLVDGRDVDNYMHFQGTCSTLEEAKAYAEALLEKVKSFAALENLPVIDWDSAPEDAICHANDRNGGGYFCSVEIEPVNNAAWYFSEGACRGMVEMSFYDGIDMPPFEGDGWKRTLQMRPGVEVKE